MLSYTNFKKIRYKDFMVYFESTWNEWMQGRCMGRGWGQWPLKQSHLPPRKISPGTAAERRSTWLHFTPLKFWFAFSNILFTLRPWMNVCVLKGVKRQKRTSGKSQKTNYLNNGRTWKLEICPIQVVLCKYVNACSPIKSQRCWNQYLRFCRRKITFRIWPFLERNFWEL